MHPSRDGDIEILRELNPIARHRYMSNARRDLPRWRDPQLRSSRSSGGEPIGVDTPVPYRACDLMGLLDEQLGRLELKNELAPYKRLKARLDTVSRDPRYQFMFGSLTVQDTMAEVLGRLFRIPVAGPPITILELGGLPSEVVNVVVSVLAPPCLRFRLVEQRAGADHLRLRGGASLCSGRSRLGLRADQRQSRALPGRDANMACRCASCRSARPSSIRRSCRNAAPSSRSGSPMSATRRSSRPASPTARRASSNSCRPWAPARRSPSARAWRWPRGSNSTCCRPRPAAQRHRLLHRQLVARGRGRELPRRCGGTLAQPGAGAIDQQPSAQPQSLAALLRQPG